MRDLLAHANREALAQFASSNLLVAFDFDGTLAPLVDDPRVARMRTATARLLRRVAVRYPTVVISGRAQSDLEEHLREVHEVHAIGHHGLEPWQVPPRTRGIVARWAARLRRRLAGLPGVVVEDKVFSVAVHYRRSRRKKDALAAIWLALQDLGAARLIAGKDVINVLPEGAPHKGVALERERARAGCDTALYVGDDEADEDVFALDRPGRLLTVRVGPRRGTRAAFCLRGQRSIDDLLRRLAAIRADWPLVAGRSA